jgi:hypothetical protein
MDTPMDPELEASIQRGIEEGRALLRRDGFGPNGEDIAVLPYFSPRRIGATAPHHREIWVVDYRETGDPETDAQFDPPLRTIHDPGFPEQLQQLLDAGLRIPYEDAYRGMGGRGSTS